MNVSAPLLWAGVALTLPVLDAADRSPVPPAGYQLDYRQNFDRPDALQDFVFTDPAAWRWSRTNGATALELVQQSHYAPPVRSPINIALLADRTFDDFILEADLLQTSQEYGHRDMCLFFGFQSPTNFYYVHLASAADEHAHNIFLVDGTPRVKIARETTKGINWGHQAWHTVRLERQAREGTIKVYFDDLAKPIMIAQDTRFQIGHIGFGSFDDTGLVDNIRIWAPHSRKERVLYFSPSRR